jgi:hypothetical protein
VTYAALAKLLIRLMNVAAIALLVIWKAGRSTLGGLMTRAAFRGLRFASHLLRVHVLFVRESLNPEFSLLSRKADSRSLSINRRCMAYDAHLTRRVCKVLCVTFDARRMTRKNRSNAFILPLMTEPAILGLSLVLDASVIKRRGTLDHRRFLYIKLGRRCCGLRRSRGRFGSFVGGRLLGAATSQPRD